MFSNVKLYQKKPFVYTEFCSGAVQTSLSFHSLLFSCPSFLFDSVISHSISLHSYLSFPFNSAKGLGNTINFHSGSRRSPAVKHILVYFEVKNNNNNNNLICIAPVCAKKTSVALKWHELGEVDMLYNHSTTRYTLKCTNAITRMGKAEKWKIVLNGFPLCMWPVRAVWGSVQVVFLICDVHVYAIHCVSMK